MLQKKRAHTNFLVEKIFGGCNGEVGKFGQTVALIPIWLRAGCLSSADAVCLQIQHLVQG